MKPLTVPAAAQRDEQAIQMLSAWIAENGLHCAVKIGMWKEAGHNESRSWGILLADVIRHVSKAMQDKYGEPADQIAEEVIQSLVRELESPTSKIAGGFSPGHS